MCTTTTWLGLLFFILCVLMFCLHVCMCITGVPAGYPETGVMDGCEPPYGCLDEPRSSVRATHTLNCRAIPSALYYPVYVTFQLVLPIVQTLDNPLGLCYCPRQNREGGERERERQRERQRQRQRDCREKFLLPINSEPPD